MEGERENCQCMIWEEDMSVAVKLLGKKQWLSHMLVFLSLFLLFFLPSLIFIPSSYASGKRIENFKIDLTFDIGVGQEKIFLSASSQAVKRAIKMLELKDSYRQKTKEFIKKMDPNVFTTRISIERKSPTPRGIRYVFSIDIDMKKLLFHMVSEGQDRFSVEITKCTPEVEHILKSVLFEYPVSATLECNVKKQIFHENSILPSRINIKVKGVLYNPSSSSPYPIDLSANFLFFSSPPPAGKIYEFFSHEFSKLHIPKKFGEIKVVVSLPHGKADELITSLNKKAYIFSVIPIGYIRKNETEDEVLLLIRYFSSVKESSVKKLIENIMGGLKFRYVEDI